MKMADIKDFILTVASGNAVESENMFNDIMADKVSFAIQARQSELARSMFQSADESTNDHIFEENSDFDAKLKSHIQGLSDIANKHWQDNKFVHDPPHFEAKHGKKYVKIVRKDSRQSSSGSAHSFIDKETGDVLKPASWNAPAKHARGNIHDEHNGLKHMGPYGPAYLK